MTQEAPVIKSDDGKAFRRTDWDCFWLELGLLLVEEANPLTKIHWVEIMSWRRFEASWRVVEQPWRVEKGSHKKSSLEEQHTIAKRTELS